MEVNVTVAGKNVRGCVPEGTSLIDDVERGGIEARDAARTNDADANDAAIRSAHRDFDAHDQLRLVSRIARGQSVEPREEFIGEDGVETRVHFDEVHAEREARRVERAVVSGFDP